MDSSWTPLLAGYVVINLVVGIITYIRRSAQEERQESTLRRLRSDERFLQVFEQIEAELSASVILRNEEERERALEIASVLTTLTDTVTTAQRQGSWTSPLLPLEPTAAHGGGLWEFFLRLFSLGLAHSKPKLEMHLRCPVYKWFWNHLQELGYVPYIDSVWHSDSETFFPNFSFRPSYICIRIPSNENARKAQAAAFATGHSSPGEPQKQTERAAQ